MKSICKKQEVRTDQMGRATHLSHGWKLLQTLIILEVHLDFASNLEWLYPRILQIK